MVKYTFMLIGSLLVRIFPLKLCYRIAELLADLAHPLIDVRRENCASNLRLITGKRQVYDLTRSVFRHLARNTVDFLRFPHLSKGELDRMTEAVQKTGFGHLRKALNRGRGVVFITPHLGNWELGGAFLASLGFAVNVVAESITPKRQIIKRQRIGQLYETYRTKAGMKVIPMEKGAMPVYRALKRGEMVVLVADRDLTGAGTVVQFFKRRVSFPRGPAYFALKTGSPIVPGYIVREGEGYVAVIEPPIEVTTGANIEALTQKISERLEVQIRRHPEQWFVFERIEEGL